MHSYLPCNLFPLKKKNTCIVTLLYNDFSLPSDIRDPLIRSFANRSKTNPFFALKSYAEQTEDMELVAKLSIVEKYGSRIPELVKRLESCFEHDFNQAGMQNILNRLLAWQSTKIFTHILHRNDKQNRNVR